ncbi:unnamed protein product [Protopolystoma xenopodis]|uniref:Uncharacterized protein n=1 Tax=Protopolystoma xenopodis TaxID=117903 RepID=A0A3S4ZC85_9PLAT|nr:unnamed protein product [Protopolystoma xenopodis]
MAAFSDDADYDAGETSENVPSPLSDAGNYGLFLSDLTYTNVAHPRVAGQPSSVWTCKINAIIDTINHFQQSEYSKFGSPYVICFRFNHFFYE